MGKETQGEEETQETIMEQKNIYEEEFNIKDYLKWREESEIEEFDYKSSK